MPARRLFLLGLGLLGAALAPVLLPLGCGNGDYAGEAPPQTPIQERSPRPQALPAVPAVVAPSVGPEVSGPGFDGVIVPAPASCKECWTPSEGQVRELESALVSYLADHPDADLLPLGEYKRQYSGYECQGKRCIIVQLFHESTDLVKSGAWKRHPIGVAGGGSNFARAWFLVDSGAILRFEINAPM